MEDVAQEERDQVDPGDVELERVLEDLDEDWKEETGAGAPEAGDRAPRADGGVEGVLEGAQEQTLEGRHLEPLVATSWGWLWKRAARQRGIDPEEDEEFQGALEDSATDDMAEALAAILDRWLPEVVKRYPNLNQLLAAVVISSIPLATYLGEHDLQEDQEESEDDAATDDQEEDGEPDLEGGTLEAPGPEPGATEELEAEGSYQR